MIIRVLTIPLELCIESIATKREALRAPPPHTSSSSSLARGKAPSAVRRPYDQHRAIPYQISLFFLYTML
jgi:hypothetical protein